jgi:hypothetical protein
MVKFGMSESDSNTLEIEIDPKALEYLKKKGDVFILTDVQNPQYSYYKIKGYEADLKIKFEEFVEFCTEYPEPQPNVDTSKPELVVNIFNVNNPLNSLPSNLGFYVARSGFTTVDDWLKTLKRDEIPECQSGQKKTYYLYHIQTS